MPAAAARETAQGNALRSVGRLDEATAAYRRAVELAPTDGDARYNLAIALRQGGDLRGAALEFRTAAHLAPGDMDAVQNVVDTLALAVERGERPFPWTCGAEATAAPVSIVVCSIDESRLAAMQASVRAALGPREHEFIVIRDARSLGEGYQRAARAARHDWIVFCHDDVELASSRPFDALERALADHDIAGLMGSDLASGPAVAWAGHPHLFGTVSYPAQERWKATVYSLRTGVVSGIQALDGLLVAARRDVVLAVGFDCDTFDGFHFYDLDFVYRAHLAGRRIAVTTEVLAIHASEGSFDAEWRRYAERFVRKFPALGSPQGPSFYFGREIATREGLVRFHEALNGLGAHP
jgi:GT2 family glycosyltransferase